MTIGMVPAILVATVLNLFYLIGKMARPHDAVLGRAEGIDGFHEVVAGGGSETIPGVIVYRFEARLFFANANYFLERAHSLAKEADPPARAFVLDAGGIATIDITAADVLGQLVQELQGQGIQFVVARANGRVIDMLQRVGLNRIVGMENFYSSVRTAVDALQAAHR